MTSIIQDLLEAANKTKYDQAKIMIKPMLINGKLTQEDIMARMARNLKLKDSTANTYYHRIARELGFVSHKDDDSTIPTKSTEDEVDELEMEDEDEFEAAEVDEDGNIVIDEEGLEDDEFVDKGNPNRQGVIRVIDNAHLVYKRQNDNGMFDELWQYNTTKDFSNSLDIKKDILAATDILPRTNQSEDGVQKYSLRTLGDIQYMKITNLPQ